MGHDTDRHFPLGEFLGMELSLTDSGSAVAQVEVGDQHLNPNGAAHGGVVFTLVDTSMGRAVVETLEGAQMCATIEVQVRFLQAVTSGSLAAESSIVRRGSRIVHLESRVVDTSGSLVATATGTFAVMTPRVS